MKWGAARVDGIGIMVHSVMYHNIFNLFIKKVRVKYYAIWSGRLDEVGEDIGSVGISFYQWGQ